MGVCEDMVVGPGGALAVVRRRVRAHTLLTIKAEANIRDASSVASLLYAVGPCEHKYPMNSQSVDYLPAQRWSQYQAC